MTSASVVAVAGPAARRRAAPERGWSFSTWCLVIGVLLLPLSVAVLAWRPELLPWVVAAPVAVGAGVVAVVLVIRHPGAGVGGAVVLFVVSGELQLRLGPLVGPLKDGALVVLVAAAGATVLRRRAPRPGLRRLVVPGAFLTVLALLYLADPAGDHGVSWLFGTRLLLSALLLAAAGVVLAGRGTVRALVGVLAVLMPLEAALAWWQRSLGWEQLVYGWGYQFGAQVRIGTDGGLRTSGTFQDPFQLAALAVVALTVGLLLTTGRLRILLCLSAVAAMVATDVRTAVLQSGLVLAVWAISRGFWRQAAVVASVGLAAATLVLATTTSSVVPGAAERPLLLTLNGRLIAWSNAVSSVDSVLVGNGVGDRGTGSTRTSARAADAPRYDEESEPTPLYAGNDAFLDSAYAQVLSDVGIVGVVALVGAGLSTATVLVRRARTPGPRPGRHDGAGRPPDPGAACAWAALALLLALALDWVGRASLASFSTGYLTMLVLGTLAGAALRTYAEAPR